MDFEQARRRVTLDGSLKTAPKVSRNFRLPHCPEPNVTKKRAKLVLSKGREREGGRERQAVGGTGIHVNI